MCVTARSLSIDAGGTVPAAERILSIAWWRDTQISEQITPATQRRQLRLRERGGRVMLAAALHRAPRATLA